MKNSSESPKKRLKASLLGYRPSAAARPAGVAVVDPELLTPESLAREEKLRLRIRQEAGVKKRLTAEAQKGLPPSTHLTKVCEVCGTEFHKPQNRTMERWEAVRFCSIQCRAAGQRTAAEVYRAEVTDKVIIDENNPVIKEMAARTLARRSLLQFTKKTHVSYNAGWVHADICKRLERFSAEVRAKKSPRLMLLMPPRTGKSELASIRFPAWHLGHSPGHEVINVGYNTDLPMRFSRRVRELVRDPLYQGIFPECRLDPESQSIESWNTTQGGGFTAAGVGGGITGKGAHVLIVDDPIKNQEEADSVYTRDSLWDWYLSTAYTRLSPGGGVLVIQCMTGDTPVLMAGGEEKRLDMLVVGDEVATYENGKLVTSTVSGFKSNGRDSVLKITTSSGKVVRANGRHPFLATTTTGELKWIRARSLSTANRIVMLPDSGASGVELPAPQKGVRNKQYAETSAVRTIKKRSGLMDTAHQAPGLNLSATLNSSTGTASLLQSMTNSLLSSVGYAPVAENLQVSDNPSIGMGSSPLTTATPLEESAGYCATIAIPELDILELSPWHLPQLGISDFTLDDIVSIEPDGVEEVFDVQVERTENFIANGLVSHNTWWNDDDLAGRLQNAMKNAEADQFEIVKYPALAEQYEYREVGSMLICRYDAPLDPTHEALIRESYARTGLPVLISPELEIVRAPGHALHPQRYDENLMKRIKATLTPRIWSALYQQNPVPDEGMYFRKEYIRYEAASPPTRGKHLFTAWDFAIGEKQMNDYTVGVTLLQDEHDALHVIDVIRFRGDSFVIVEAMLDTYMRWGIDTQADYVIGVEDGQIWKSIKPLLEKRMTERKNFPSYETLKPLTDKIARARPLQGRMQQGRVYFPENASWLPDAIHELLRFPAGVHDDIVDALAWAVHLSMSRPPPRPPEYKELPSWRDKMDGLGALDGSHMAA